MKNLEHNAQVAVFQWAALAKARYPELNWLFATQGGGKRHIATAARMKKEGGKRGIPDIILLHPSGPYHGLAIELKKENGGKLSPEQKAWIENLNSEGYLAVVCRGSEEAIQTIKEYLKLPKFPLTTH